MEDNVKAHVLLPDGSYEKPDKRGKVLVNSQEQFCQEAVHLAKEARKKLDPDPISTRVFIPVEGQI